jgi:hypothetical protein
MIFFENNIDSDNNFQGHVYLTDKGRLFQSCSSISRHTNKQSGVLFVSSKFEKSCKPSAHLNRMVPIDRGGSNHVL